MANDSTMDADVIMGASVDVTLGGRTYTWNEPKRRTARYMCRDIGDVMAEIENAKHDLYAQYVCSLMLDFFYKWNDAMKNDANELELADAQEIWRVWNEVTVFILSPFAKAAPKTE